MIKTWYDHFGIYKTLDDLPNGFYIDSDTAAPGVWYARNGKALCTTGESFDKFMQFGYTEWVEIDELCGVHTWSGHGKRFGPYVRVPTPETWKEPDVDS